MSDVPVERVPRARGNTNIPNARTRLELSSVVRLIGDNLVSNPEWALSLLGLVTRRLDPSQLAKGATLDDFVAHISDESLELLNQGDLIQRGTDQHLAFVKELIAQGEMYAATRELCAVIAKDSNNQEAVLLLSECDAGAGNMLDAYCRLLAASSRSPFVAFAAALEQIKVKLLDQVRNERDAESQQTRAIEIAQTVVALAPDSDADWAALAHLESGLRRESESLEHIDVAISLAPSNAEHHRLKGNLLERSGLFVAALASARTALFLSPNEALLKRDVRRLNRRSIAQRIFGGSEPETSTLECATRQMQSDGALDRLRETFLARGKTLLALGNAPPPVEASALAVTSGEASLFIRSLYRIVLGREPDSTGFVQWTDRLTSGAIDLHQVLPEFLASSEFKAKMPVSKQLLDDEIPTTYHSPDDLVRKPLLPKKILMIGSCLLEPWRDHFRNYCAIDFFSVNNIPQLPPEMPGKVEDYDFQLVQLSLRNIFPELSYFSLDRNNLESLEHAFEAGCGRMTVMLQEYMRWNSDTSLLTFVCNFFVPQQNPLGRFAPKYELSNLAFLVEKLNERLYFAVSKYKNAFILDIAQLSSNFGRRGHQDDAQALSLHNSFLGDFDFNLDSHRIEKTSRISRRHATHVKRFTEATWKEILALFRTVKSADSIKLVIFDLDDSLWRGIAAEGALDQFGVNVREGWPLGVIEACIFLKKRGVLLAIASKNSEAEILKLFSPMTADTISLGDFASVKIGWQPKVDSVASIMREINLLPSSVLFIDDNPVERASVAAAFPEIRVLGGDPYQVKRILLWASELQTTLLTEESARRTEMVQSQLTREGVRKSLSRDDFLASLKINIEYVRIVTSDHTSFARSFELLNKTNQFNTTGLRWSRELVEQFFVDGGSFWAFTVEDIYSKYGLVCVAATRGSEIVQLVMSCRVLGLDIEIYALERILLEGLSDGAEFLSAQLVETDSNLACRDCYARAGFIEREGVWYRSRVGSLTTAEERSSHVLEKS